ncbi:hypothetical protein GUJ93_ZPchr0011g28617 [Zizania palustris]|uniref:No apical meristem-associated C-terminal domain-containing protein n=1 Tax=Zizania palustris TaxID=103762 RepID=A0A8J5WE47_ZIZPA|nr:hypothetical protein GUJ93_ZPchr0011g28617 [Zizania palustris]
MLRSDHLPRVWFELLLAFPSSSCFFRTGAAPVRPHRLLTASPHRSDRLPRVWFELPLAFPSSSCFSRTGAAPVRPRRLLTASPRPGFAGFIGREVDGESAGAKRRRPTPTLRWVRKHLHPAKWNEWLAKEWNKGTKEKASPQDVTDGSTGASGQEGTEGSNIPTRPIGRDKAKRMRTCPAGSSSSSSAYIDVLQKIHEDRSKYDARVEAATIEEAQAIATRAERKLALQEKHVSIQEKQLEIATELLNLQKEDREDKVMSLDVEKMSPWVRDYYIRKQKEIAARAASGASSSDLS